MSRITKATAKALEAVFAREIDGILPLQSKAKIYRELEEQGLVCSMQLTFGSGQFKATASGYELTHAGRLLYCSWAAGQDHEDLA